MTLKTKIMRPAIAMIELIFAIVIMGIILMSAPQLISTATKSGYVAIQQEAINEAASRVNMIMGYQWDENSADETVLDPILQTASPVTELAESTYIDGNGTGRRIGTPLESYRSFLRPDGSRPTATAAGTLGSDGIENDIDDFIGIIGLNLAGTGTGTNYIEKNVTIDTEVFYISDGVDGDYNAGNAMSFDADFTQESATTTNIKRISTTLTSDAASPDELEKTIILHAFSCNIGGYKLEERDF
jgi:type II secretory pathway pseudopilin PulG